MVVDLPAPFGPSRRERLAGGDVEADAAHRLDAARIGLAEPDRRDRGGVVGLVVVGVHENLLGRICHAAPMGAVNQVTDADEEM